MSDLIKSLKLVDGNGTLRTLPEIQPASAEVSTKDVLLAAQVSLGVLGVVVEFTLEVQEMSTCRVQNLFDMEVNVSFV